MRDERPVKDEREEPARLDREEARQGWILRNRPMIRALGISLVLAVIALVVAYALVV